MYQIAAVPPAEPWSEKARALDLAEEAPPPPPPLARDLGLGEIEVSILAAAAAPAFDSGFETLFAYAQNDATRRQPTVGLMLDLLTDDPLARAHALSLFAPDAPLRSFRLLAPAAGDLVMWESWLRHEALPGRGKKDRISISFNYGWA